MRQQQDAGGGRHAKNKNEIIIQPCTLDLIPYTAGLVRNLLRYYDIDAS